MRGGWGKRWDGEAGGLPFGNLKSQGSKSQGNFKQQSPGIRKEQDY